MLYVTVTIAVFFGVIMNAHVASFSTWRTSLGLPLKRRIMDQTRMALTGKYGALVRKNASRLNKSHPVDEP